MKSPEMNRRILIVDDNHAIHDDIRSVLVNRSQNRDLDALSADLFGSKPSAACTSVEYKIESAYQGQEGFELVDKAVVDGNPYALAFVDVRMPPGWDGIQTVKKMKEVDKELQVVICTAYSDYSWQETLETLGLNDWLLVLKKPFDVIEVQQMAYAMTEKWNLARRAAIRTESLESSVESHEDKLRQMNDLLQSQIASLAEANTRLSKEAEARRDADSQVRHMAFHDALTGLPNRLLLSERIEECVDLSRCMPNYKFAVLYCDIDNFKLVNDSLGHRVGDQYLLKIANRLVSSLRLGKEEERDTLDMVSRLGGDEFVVLLDSIPSKQEAIAIAERIREGVEQPVKIDDHDLGSSISIGVAVSDGEYLDASEILRDADTALYHAKGLGKARVATFDHAMRARVTERMLLEQELRTAIEEEQFVVYFQPIVCLKTGRVTSTEALIRWNHPVDGLRSPDSFIPTAEESGLIDPIGKLVLRNAMKQTATWRATLPGAEDLCININLSPRQLVSRKLVRFLDECFEESNLNPAALRLEITETAMMDDLPLVHGIIEELFMRNIQIHLDDFGTGYSSLSIMHTLPFSTIKIDRSFVTHLSEDMENSTTIQAISMLAKSKGMKIVAEGIENAEQLLYLRNMNCDFGQGFYFSKPLPASELEAFFRHSISNPLIQMPEKQRTLKHTARI